LLWAQEQRRGLGDEACVVNNGISSGRGRWQRIRASTVVGNDGTEAPGRTQQWHEGSVVDSMTAWRLRGGLDDGTESGEVDSDTGSRENFGRKFW
jgi:hypothetical protein